MKQELEEKTQEMIEIKTKYFELEKEYKILEEAYKTEEWELENLRNKDLQSEKLILELRVMGLSFDIQANFLTKECDSARAFGNR